MGKRKEGPCSTDEEQGDDSSTYSPHKKHKKHKKKHKKRKSEEHSSTGPVTYSASPCSEGKSTIKLKIRIGGETLSTTSVTPCVEDIIPTRTVPKESVMTVGSVNVTDDAWEDDDEDVEVDTGPEPHKSESDEEKKWLDALEKGELDDYGELKKMKDPSLLTARQKALLHGKQESDLQQLPSGYKVAELTEEQLQRRQQRAKKRRQQAHEKREKDKKLTIDRLLKKQATKGKGSKGKSSRRANIPRFSYRNTPDLITISVPHGYNVPVLTQPPVTSQPPKGKVLCGVHGCKKPKKYSCSKTGVPLCSLECYKKNLAKHNKGGHMPVTFTAR